MHCPNAFPTETILVPHTKDLRTLLMSAMLLPSRRADLRVAIQRALNTWENRPMWLVDLADCLDSFEIHPQVVMTQSQARGKFRAKLRMDISNSAGEAIPAGQEVNIAWNRSYRVYPEGAVDSELIHEYQLRYASQENPAQGPVFALVTHDVMYDFKPPVV